MKKILEVSYSHKPQKLTIYYKNGKIKIYHGKRALYLLRKFA